MYLGEPSYPFRIGANVSVGGRIEISVLSAFVAFLLSLARADHHPKSRLERRICGTLGSTVQPVFKILNLDDMGNFRIPDLHGDCAKSFSDVANPLVTLDRGDSLGNCFVESLGRHLERMRGAVQIVDNDGAGFERHTTIYHIRLLFAHVDVMASLSPLGLSRSQKD